MGWGDDDVYVQQMITSQTMKLDDDDFAINGHDDEEDDEMGLRGRGEGGAPGWRLVS